MKTRTLIIIVVVLIIMLLLTFLPFKTTTEYFPEGYEERFPDFVEAVCKMEKTFTYEQSRGTPREMVNEVWLLHPEIIWLNNYISYEKKGTDYVVHMTYTSSRMGAKFKQIRMNFTIDHIVNQALKEETQLDMLRYIHDALAKKTDYTQFTPMSSTAYGCMVQGLALCQGYTNAFTILARQCGIECGPVEGGNHVWNYVILDGKEYMVDVTWDAPLAGTSNAYKYFMLTPEEMGRDHSIAKDYYQKYSKQKESAK